MSFYYNPPMCGLWPLLVELSCVPLLVELLLLTHRHGAIKGLLLLVALESSSLNLFARLVDLLFNFLKGGINCALLEKSFDPTFVVVFFGSGRLFLRHQLQFSSAELLGNIALWNVGVGHESCNGSFEFLVLLRHFLDGFLGGCDLLGQQKEALDILLELGHVALINTRLGCFTCRFAHHFLTLSFLLEARMRDVNFENIRTYFKEL